MADKPAVVYIYHHPRTHETYVGSTGDEKVRQAHHLSALRHGRHPNKRFQAAFDRNPDFDYVGVDMTSRDEAFDCEQAILDEFRGNPLLLNLSRDARYGVTEGYTHSEEAKRKIAAAARGNKNCLGKQLSEERRQKLIVANTGRIVSEETREKIRQANMGFVHSPEALEKNRLAHLGVVLSEETRRKLSQAHIGKPKSDDHAAKIRAAKQEVARRVSADGTMYSSLQDAARQLGLNPGTVHHRVNSLNHPSWFYIED